MHGIPKDWKVNMETDGLLRYIKTFLYLNHRPLLRRDHWVVLNEIWSIRPQYQYWDNIPELIIGAYNLGVIDEETRDKLIGGL